MSAVNNLKNEQNALTNAIKEHIDVLDLAQRYGYHVYRVGRNEYALEEHDSVRLNPVKKLFIRNSNKEISKGTVIDLCMFLENCDDKKAIKILRGMLSPYQIDYSQTSLIPLNHSKPKREAPIDIPKKNPYGYKRIYAYLCKTRCIDNDVVKNLIDRKMLFEDEKHHNCVWLGYDYDGKAKFGCKRVTIDKNYMPKYVLKSIPKNDNRVDYFKHGIFYNKEASFLFVVNSVINKKILEAMLEKSAVKNIILVFDDKSHQLKFKNEMLNIVKSFNIEDKTKLLGIDKWICEENLKVDYNEISEPFVRGDLPGSKKSIGMFINNKSPTLFVTEAPIDTMSIMTFFNRDNNFNFNNYSYLAQAGTNGISSLIYHIQHQPNINKIYLCYDNDEAGEQARQDARSELQKIGYKGAVLDKIPIGNDFNDDLRKSIENTAKQQQNKKQTQQKTTYNKENDKQCQISY